MPMLCMMICTFYETKFKQEFLFYVAIIIIKILS